MKIGDIVYPVEGHSIYCSHAYYDRAVVKSVDPFILVSHEGDMTWHHQKPENFEVE